MDLDDHGWGSVAREADFRVINGTGYNVVDETTLAHRQLRSRLGRARSSDMVSG
jgi:hypothetical protein